MAESGKIDLTVDSVSGLQSTGEFFPPSMCHILYHLQQLNLKLHAPQNKVSTGTY